MEQNRGLYQLGSKRKKTREHQKGSEEDESGNNCEERDQVGSQRPVITLQNLTCLLAFLRLLGLPGTTHKAESDHFAAKNSLKLSRGLKMLLHKNPQIRLRKDKTFLLLTSVSFSFLSYSLHSLYKLLVFCNEEGLFLFYIKRCKPACGL